MWIIKLSHDSILEYDVTSISWYRVNNGGKGSIEILIEYDIMSTIVMLVSMEMWLNMICLESETTIILCNYVLSWNK